MKYHALDPYEEGISEEESQRRVIAALTEGLRPGEHPYNLRRALEHFEARHIAKVLDMTGRDLPHTAQLLGITEELLDSKMKEYNLN